MKTASSEHVVNTDCFLFVFVLTFKTICVHNMIRTRNSINNLLSYYGLVDARISASEKDLPVSSHKLS